MPTIEPLLDTRGKYVFTKREVSTQSNRLGLGQTAPGKPRSS